MPRLRRLEIASTPRAAKLTDRRARASMQVQIIGGGVSKRYIYDVSSAITLGAFVGACEATVLQTTDVPLCAVLAVGVRLLMAPFCTGFAGKEAFSAFVAIVSFNKVRPGQQGVFED